tara:strand:+ start:747 stop:2711 length:1965 start_codon:yes stop_codon:yes gene_type:complete
MATLAEMIAQDNQASAIKEQDIENNTERFRTAMQGMTFGGADEAEAFFMSMFSDESYDENLAGIRKKLHKYNEDSPMEALAYEIGGAALPTIIASIFTGGGAAAAQGARLFPTLAKFATKIGGKPNAAKMTGFMPAAAQGAKIGAGEGAAYAFGTSEGDMYDRALAAPAGAITGLLGGAGGGAIGEGVKIGISAISDTARRVFGKTGSKAVESELDRLVKETGKSVDEIVADVASGRLMIENKTLRETVRAYLGKGGPQGARIKTEMPKRSAAAQDAAIDRTRSGMTNIEDPNLTRGMADIITKERDLESIARKPFQTARASGEILSELRRTVKRMPKAAELAAQEIQLSTGSGPFFKINAGGDVVLNPNITQAQAEAVMAHAGQVAQGYSEKTMTKRLAPAAFGVQNDLRKVIDDNVEGMAGVRAKSALTFAKEEAFKQGKKLKGKSVDEASILINETAAKSPEAMDALRSGVLSSFNDKISQSGGKSSFINSLNREGSKDRELLLALFPEDSIDDVLNKMDIAKGAKDAESYILGGSPTQGTQAAASRIGDGMLEDAINVTTNPMAAARIAGKLIKSMGLDIGEAEKAKVIDILMNSNPREVADALTDSSKLSNLVSKISNALSVSVGAAAQGTARVGGGFGGNVTSGLLSQ